MLKENKDIVTYIVEKGVANGHKFHSVTNGYDLEAYADLLSPDKIARLQITLDGYRPPPTLQRSGDVRPHYGKYRACFV